MTGVKTLLAVVPDVEGGLPTLETACIIGRDLACHVRVLHVRPDPSSALPLMGEAMSGAMIDQMMATCEKEGTARAVRVRGIFDQLIARYDIPQTDEPPGPSEMSAAYIELIGQEDEAAVSYGRMADVVVIGRPQDDIASSEYLQFYHNINESPLPYFDINTEVLIQKVLRVLNEKSLVSSASPVGKGGVFFTLLRAAIPNGLGFDITTDAETRKDAFLFGEAMGRIIVDVDPDKEDEFVDVLSDLKVPFFTLGHITKGEIRIDDESFGYTGKMTLGA